MGAQETSQPPAFSWRTVLRRTVAEFADDHLLQWAAALTFFAVLSLFPSMLALVSVLGVIGAPAVEPLIENASRLAPGNAREIALDALENIRASADGAGVTFAVGLVAALWSASAYVGAFIPAANIVWAVEEARPFARRLLVRVWLTIALLLLIALTGLAAVLTGPIAEHVGSVVGLGDAAVDAWQVAKWPALAAVLMLVLGVLYRVAPNVEHTGWRAVLPGSVVAVVLWVVGSLGFTLYVTTIARFNATYGSIGGVLVFLLWLWLTNIAILLGAVLNAEIVRERQRSRRA